VTGDVPRERSSNTLALVVSMEPSGEKRKGRAEEMGLACITAEASRLLIVNCGDEVIMRLSDCKRR
jgi:hypothetical protein